MGPRAQKKKQEYLSPAERQGLEDQRRELEAELHNEEKYGAGSGNEVDKNKIQKQIRSIDNAIHVRTPGRLSAINKDRLYKQEKELEASIAEGMPTEDEMRRPGRNPGAVRKHMNWDARNRERIKQYREIQRQLRPDDPKSIEALRKR